MMHVVGASVREHLVPDGTTPPSWPDPHLFAGSAVAVWRPFEAIRENGVIGTPSEASPQAGARLFEAAVARSRETLLTLQSTYGQRSTP
jgi:creatinine amidohydrolase